MVMHKVEIQPTDTAGWKQWMDCMASMVDELRGLTVPSVDEILEKYECRRVEFGMGLNVDWPEGHDGKQAATQAEVVPGQGEISQR